MDAEVVAVAAEVAAVVVEGMVIGPVLIQGKLFLSDLLIDEFLILTLFLRIFGAS